MLTWKFLPFDQLQLHDLYRILQLRSEVFVLEQVCIYQDMDDKDQMSFHLSGWLGNTLVAYARILPPGISCNHPSIGRVITHPSYRGHGYGKELMQLAIRHTRQSFNSSIIQIGAQQYLAKFYSSLGFLPVSEPYLEDGIPHILMRLGD